MISKKYNISVLLFFLLWMLNFKAKAQSITDHAFYQNGWQTVNPAAMDRAYYLSRYNNADIITSFSSIYFNNQSSSNFLSIETYPNSEKKKFSVGFYGLFNKNGVFQGIDGTLNACYTFEKVNGWQLRTGINLLYKQLGVNNLRLENMNDIVLPEYEGVRLSGMDMGAGLFLRHEEGFYTGLSLKPKILSYKKVESTSEYNLLFGKLLFGEDKGLNSNYRQKGWELSGLLQFRPKAFDNYNNAFSATFSSRMYFPSNIKNADDDDIVVNNMWVGLSCNTNLFLSAEWGFTFPGLHINNQKVNKKRNKYRLSLAYHYEPTQRIRNNIPTAARTGVELNFAYIFDK